MKIWKKEEIMPLDLRFDDLTYLLERGIGIGDYCIVQIYEEFEINNGVVLAYDSDIPIVCNRVGVMALEDAGSRFVNSSVESFILSITRFKQYCNQVAKIEDENEALYIVQDTILDIKKIDASAWLSDMNYWSIVGEHMVNGNI